MILTDKVYGVIIFENKLKKKRGRNKMNCPKCGEFVPDDAIFCSKCGSRVDGKKNCVRCGKSIDEGNVYCNYCGARQDGKTVCPKCGTAYEGIFCPKCGEKHEEVKAAPKQEAVKAVDPQLSAEKTANREALKDKIMFIIQASLLFGAIICMAVFSFFIGYSAEAEVGRQSASASVNAIDLIFKQWEALIDYIESLESVYDKIYTEGMFVLIAPSVLCAVVLVANIVVCLTYLGLAIYAFCKNIGKKEFKMYKYAVPPVVTTMLSLFTVLGFTSFAGGQSFYDNYGNELFELNNLLNGPAIAEIVVVAGLMTAAFVLELVRRGSEYKDKIYKLVSLPVAAVFIAIAAGIFGNVFIVIADEKYSFNMIMSDFMITSGLSQIQISDIDVGINAMFIAEFAVFMLIVVSAALVLYFALKALDKEKGNNKFALAFAIVNTVMFIAYLVLNVVIVNSFEKSDLLTSSSEIDLGGTAIAGLILSFLALVAIIINLALAKKVKSVSVDLPAENA